MQIESRITFDQYKATLEAMRNPAIRRFGKTNWLRIAVIIVFSFSLFIAIKTPARDNSALIGFLILFFPLCALWLWATYKTKSCLKEHFAAQEKQLNNQRMYIDESGIVGKSADDATSYQYKWSAFESFIDLPDAYLLLPNSVTFVRIPKNLLNIDEQENIRRWAEPAVRKKP